MLAAPLIKEYLIGTLIFIELISSLAFATATPQVSKYEVEDRGNSFFFQYTQSREKPGFFLDYRTLLSEEIYYLSPAEYERGDIHFSPRDLDNHERLEANLRFEKLKAYSDRNSIQNDRICISSFLFMPIPIVNSTTILPTLEKELEINSAPGSTSTKKQQLKINTYVEMNVDPAQINVDPIQQFNRYGFQIYLKY